MRLEEWCAKAYTDDPKLSHLMTRLKSAYPFYLEIDTKKHDCVEICRWVNETFDNNDFVEVWSKFFFINEPDAVQFKLTWY